MVWQWWSGIIVDTPKYNNGGVAYGTTVVEWHYGCYTKI